MATPRVKWAVPATARLPKVYVHLFRHTFAHQLLADGMQEGDVMRIGHRQHSRGDRL